MESANIHQRIKAIMVAAPYVQKVQRKNGLQYTFVNRDAIVSKIRPAMIEHGIIYYPHVIGHSHEGNKIILDVEHHYVNIDCPQDAIVFSTVSYGVDTQDKGPGKALTYAEKQAHIKLFMIESGDEDESEHYDDEAKPAKKKRPIEEGKPAENIVKLTLDEVRARYADVQSKLGMSKDAMTEAMAKEVKNKKDPVEIARFLNGLESRYSSYLGVLELLTKYSVSSDGFIEILDRCEIKQDLNGKTWHMMTADQLNQVALKLEQAYDLPFGGE